MEKIERLLYLRRGMAKETLKKIVSPEGKTI